MTNAAIKTKGSFEANTGVKNSKSGDTLRPAASEAREAVPSRTGLAVEQSRITPISGSARVANADRFSKNSEREKGSVSYPKELALERPGIGLVRGSAVAANAGQFEETPEERKNREFLEAYESEEERERTLLLEARRRERLVEEAVAREEAEEDAETGGETNFSGNREPVRLSAYAGPLLVACFADLADLTIILALPGIKTVLSICCTILIFLLLFFPKRRYRIASNTRLAIIDAFILLGSVPLEGLLFPFNVLPFTVGAVGMIYMTDKKFVAARNSKKFDRKKMKTNLDAVIREARTNRNRKNDQAVSLAMKNTWESTTA